ncbi:uncharacterized protein LOC119293363 [Triticum dicoccoides]|uniref:Uncharacterized protein n=2 Tax=Triticum TaxID=4564 RepID=A0A9R0QGU3_TRITD|nr:uncharacterized protein LOC119293363 [Triticum dicoccoides]XP_044348235.1 uncharacterized protein LOC123069441 [Triticum aestivum]VAH11219.1 unnamed protein product [Triticum turgidum subsp. durum]
MAHMRVVHRDEEGHKVAEKLPVPETRRPDTARHVERKLEEQGLHRLERHPANAPRGVGIGAPPPKSGRGGKYTWEGPEGLVDSELDPAPAAIDRNDPNYDEEEGGEQDEVAKEVVVGEVEVAKVAQARAGVARVEVAPPLLQDHDHQQ